MKKIGLLLCFTLMSVFSFAVKKNIDRPKLVVGIVVDQMRWDYLYRFYDKYQSNGFKRLMNDGFNCQQTRLNYLPAFTGPGHSCIYTGSVPSIHGIAANDWIDNFTGRSWYCAEDTTVSSVGSSSKAGMMSPRNLLTTTITDELRLATNFKSSVFGISIKDRGAILPAGHLANGAFWFDDSNGDFISSSYYGNQLPSWLVDFNNQHLPDSFLKKGWNTLYPLNLYTESLSDNNPYEGNFSKEKTPVFPHLMKGEIKYGNLRKMPAGNTYSILASEACINGEHLGAENTTDFLCLSLSCTDYVGHQFAPNSIEIEDTYLRLDNDLASFFNYLDKKVGKGNYLLFLTADHGGAQNAQYLQDINIPAGNDDETTTSKELINYISHEFKSDSLIRGLENYQVYLNEDKIKATHTNRNDLIASIKNWFKQKPEVAYVINLEDIGNEAIPEPIKTMAINGYNRKRSGSILVVEDPGWYYGYGKTGTVHGTWNPYDSHIPLLWYGWDIKKGSTNNEVHMEDIAATLAAMLHIQMPNGCIGKVITEIANK